MQITKKKRDPKEREPIYTLTGPQKVAQKPKEKRKKMFRTALEVKDAKIAAREDHFLALEAKWEAEEALRVASWRLAWLESEAQVRKVEKALREAMEALEEAEERWLESAEAYEITA